MSPGRTVRPEASMTSAPAVPSRSGPVVTRSIRPSSITMVVSRTGARPVPSISVPPRSTIMTRSPSQARVTGAAATQPLHALDHRLDVQLPVGLVAKLLVAAHHVGQDPLGLAPRGVHAQLDVTGRRLGRHAGVEALLRLPAHQHQVVA